MLGRPKEITQLCSLIFSFLFFLLLLFFFLVLLFFFLDVRSRILIFLPAVLLLKSMNHKQGVMQGNFIFCPPTCGEDPWR